MPEDPMAERFVKRLKQRKLRELAKRARSTEDVEDEEEVLRKAQEERQKEPSKYQLHGGEGAGRNDPCPCGSGKKYKKCCGVGK